MTGALVAGVLAGLGLAVPLGPVGAYVVALSARTSFRHGAAAGLGVATADGLYALLAVVGGSALAGAAGAAAGPLRWLSVAVLLAVAARTLLAAARPAGDLPGPAAGGVFLRLFGLTLLNPTTVAYVVALVAGAPGGALHSPSERAAFVAAVAVASAGWQLLLAAGGVVVGRRLVTARARVATAVVSCAVVLVLAARLALAG